MPYILKTKTVNRRKNKIKPVKILVKASEHQHQRIKCSHVDRMIRFTPAKIAFCYQTMIPSEMFIRSLEQVLVDFPIFAGILIRIKRDYYIDCTNKGVAVSIEHLSKPLLFEKKDFHIETKGIVDNLNVHKAFLYKKPLIHIKLRYYQNGMTIGCSWSHGLCDMSGLMIFFKAISLCAQGKSYQIPLFVEDRDDFFETFS